MDKDLENYYTKGRTVGSKWNFDLKPLIEKFDLEEFCANAGTEDSNAFIVFTNHQYIMGYTAGFGQGSHLHLFGRVHKELYGGGNINSEQEAIRESAELQRDALTVRIFCNETEGLNGKYHQGRLYFDTDSLYRKQPDITPSQYEQFLKFCEEHGDEVSRICEKYGMVVEFTTYSPSHLLKHTSKNLDEVAEFLKMIAIAPEQEDKEEVILNKQQTLR